jgi:hypothetical protein
MKQNLGGHKFQGDSEVETRWLTVQVAGFCQQGYKRFVLDMMYISVVARTVWKTYSHSQHLSLLWRFCMWAMSLSASICERIQVEDTLLRFGGRSSADEVFTFCYFRASRKQPQI